MKRLRGMAALIRSRKCLAYFFSLELDHDHSIQ